MTGTQALRHHDNFLQVAKSYYQLTKPRIIPLLLITTAASMEIASKGQVSPLLLFLTLLGGTLAAAGSSNLKLHL
jgi:protoheme IX farnesyltransferase